MRDFGTPSRRDFLRGTATAAAGVVLAGGLDLTQAAHANGGDTRRSPWSVAAAVGPAPFDSV